MHAHAAAFACGLAALALSAAPAAAETTSVSPYWTGYAEQVIDVDDYDYDSDWQPADSPIQVRLVVHAGNTIGLDMVGDALFDWSDGTVWIEAEPAMGSYEVDLGLFIGSYIRFDIMGIEWEGEVGDPIEFQVTDLVDFEPYLLPGNPDSPLDITTEVERQNVIDYDALDLYVASASLMVDLSGSLNTWFETTAVTVIPDGVDGGVASLEAYREPESLALQDVEPLEYADAQAQLEGDVVFTTDLHAWPSVVVDVLGTEYTLAEFDIPIELPAIEDHWIFDVEALSFQRPEPPPEPEDTGETGEDDDGDGDGGDDEGCGCAGAGHPGGGLLALAWLALGGALVSRRRR
jgi:MYXO-CTERM domain-containing protein